MSPGEETGAPSRVVDLGFMDARSKLLDLAAFLDRVERCGGQDDFRVVALREALQELSASTGRARRILERLSDPSTDPISAAPAQSACGVPSPRGR
jgi:hypothetical protein